MKHPPARLLRFLLRLSPWLLASSLAAAADTPPPADCPVATLEATWHDASRNRDVPVKIYYPTGEHAPKTSPVIVFSHGLGGSRDGYAYLGEAWARHGFISVHPTHLGSDTSLLTEARRPGQKLRALKHSLSDPANFTNRPLDVSFVLNQLEKLNQDAAFALHGRLDLKHVGVAGHSFGAYTVLAVVGQAIGPAARVQYFGPDPRVSAAIAMSSQAGAADNLEHAYERIAVPVFHLTGTKDESIGGHASTPDGSSMGHTSAADRRVAYDHTRHATAYLLTFQGGDHMVFSGRDVSHEAASRRLLGLGAPSDLSPETRQAMQREVVAASIAFWDATLRRDAAAQRWLEGGAFAKELGALGTFEQKHPAPAKP